MRENGAMHGGADSHKPSATSLIPIAFAAVAVLVVALAVAKGRPGTIVIQALTERIASKAATGPEPPAVSVTMIAETSASGELKRILMATSVTPGIESVLAGNLVQVYMPSDDTIYVLSQDALATTEFVNGHRVTARRQRPITISYAGSWLAPGRTSFFAVQLHRHNYRVAGRTTIDGRQALRLVPVHTPITFGAHGNLEMRLEPAYVTPVSYQPIEEIQPGFGTTVWSAYRVLPDTANNQRLLSLRARHPRARVSHSASAYFRAVRKLQ